MNRIFKTITLLGVTLGLNILSPHVQAQSPQQTQPNPPATATPTNTPSSESLDVDLLAKTVSNFVRSDRYQTESDVQIKGTTSGASYTFYVQINTITQFPNKFRSEIAFAQPNSSAGPKYLVVSDGNQVTVYRADSGQYATMSYQAFKDSNDSFLMGISSYMFLDLPPDLREMIVQDQLSETQLVASLNQLVSSSSNALAGGQRDLMGKNAYVYEFSDPKGGLGISVFVDPTTATVERIEIAGEDSGLDIGLSEQIIRRTDNPVITADTFRFVPPAESTKVEALPIQPF